MAGKRLYVVVGKAGRDKCRTSSYFNHHRMKVKSQLANRFEVAAEAKT